MNIPAVMITILLLFIVDYNNLKVTFVQYRTCTPEIRSLLKMNMNSTLLNELIYKNIISPYIRRSVSQDLVDTGLRIHCIKLSRYQRYIYYIINKRRNSEDRTRIQTHCFKTELDKSRFSANVWVPLLSLHSFTLEWRKNIRMFFFAAYICSPLGTEELHSHVRRIAYIPYRCKSIIPAGAKGVDAVNYISVAVGSL